MGPRSARRLARHVIADSLDNTVPGADLREKRDALQTSLHKIYLAAPFTDDEARKRRSP